MTRSTIRPDDLAYCHEAIKHGSLSFHAASKLLPKRVRDPALALYAFCRLADDAVDLNAEKAAAVLRLRERLELAYRGTPLDQPTDRAFAALIEDHDMPRALPEALLEGLAWDACEKRYETLSDVYSYSARVASAVGAMMCVLMGVRDEYALARACDLGVAMQLTNIARDIGEDALERRVYLPTQWLDQAGIDTETFFADPKPTKAVRAMARKLVLDANRLYIRSEAGVALLPREARLGIMAARLIYAGIGREVQRNGYDSITTRAHTSKAQKIGWIAKASAKAGATMIAPRSAVIYAKPLPEVAFLVEAAAHARPAAPFWGDGVIGILADLKAREVEQRGLGAS
ncbi:15-cis-phytoene synthase [Nereida sp. MMG025]|uniref:15-cis-phytoene synthase n=1 Tax=Nereida sp. MMG025 TaxID=2909981 RepID=UPI001F372F5D|nr:phytoene/squalene synthase family protein [Nereida sp. MMG025]MCF6445994.1 phytoene/squalene synthase family protein [Nereida sp. MMG025]